MVIKKKIIPNERTTGKATKVESLERMSAKSGSRSYAISLFLRLIVKCS
jgi:hypothetical protein